MTRIQKERFTDPAAYEAVKGIYRIDQEAMARMRKYAVLMHPLPRVDEISPEVDDDPRSAYFRQARNGLHIRMALLDRLLS
jgi:aspartate carbamoyltransferase catalytic subunit